MKKIVIFTLCLLPLIFASWFMSCSRKDNKASPSALQIPEGLIAVGFSQVGSESDWRLANTRSMRDTFSRENGYFLILRDAQQRLENQLAAIREFIALKVDYIVFAPVTETGWDNVLREAKDAGIPVIIVDRMISTSDVNLFTCWVGSNFRMEGDIAVAWMESKFRNAPDLKIVHLQGTLGSSAQIGRSEALEAAVARNRGWEIIHSASGEFSQVRGKEVMEPILKQHSRIDVLYVENDDMAFGAMDAMYLARATYGVNGDITIVSFDATRAGLEATLDGRINFNVECNPLHGPRVEALIQQLKRGGTPDKLIYVEETAFDATTITQEDINARAY